MRFERCDGYWLWVGGPVMPGAAATTIGRVVLVRATAVDDEVLLRHEAEHVTQYRRYGLVGFLARYLADYGRWRARGYPHWSAYRRIGFEVEAEWASRRWAASGSPVGAAGERSDRVGFPGRRANCHSV